MESVWTMSESKVLPAPGEIPNDSLTAVAVEPLIIEGEHDKQLPPGFTLRVKPDRRRVQLPIPVELDRRRSR